MSVDISHSPLRRVFQSTVWLLGGKGFGAICSLIYLAILARTLGLKGFGHFSLIFGTAQAMIAVAGFQTWRAVVRYGSEHVHNQAWGRLGRLGMLCGILDAAGAVAGCLLAFVLIYGFANALDLNPAYIDTAFWFCCAMVWALVSAPTGIVRALNRFDMAVYVEAVVPLGRVLAAVAIWQTGPSVGRFLFAWAAIDILEAVCYWAMARRLSPQAIRPRYLGQWRQALAENPGIIRFIFATYGSTLLDAVVKFGPLLAVGGLVGTRAAGLYRMASQLAQAMSKLNILLTRAVYAEVARVRVVADSIAFRKLAVQVSLIAAGAGAVVIAAAFGFGRQLLALIGGGDFQRGAEILVPLAVAASFELASVAFEPVLQSIGKAGRSLIARSLSVMVLLLATAMLYPRGAEGIAWATAMAGATIYIAMGLMAFLALRQIEREERSGQPPT